MLPKAIGNMSLTHCNTIAETCTLLPILVKVLTKEKHVYQIRTEGPTCLIKNKTTSIKPTCSLSIISVAVLHMFLNMSKSEVRQ